MKKMKYIQITSLFLCLLMLVVGCAEETPVAEEQKIEDEAPVIITVDPIRSNFITLEQKQNDAYEIELALSDLYGEFISLEGDLILFKKSEKDYMNNLTETYVVYSVSEDKEVKTIVNTYADEDYTRLDDFGNQVRPEKTVDVSIETCGYGSTAINYIKVVTTTYTPIDEEIIEKEELEDSYSASYNVDFYDAKGTIIATSKYALEAEFMNVEFDTVKLSFGKTIAIFDAKENKLVKTYDGDVAVETISSSFSNAKYDYYFGHPYGNVNYGMPMGACSKIIVNDKKGNTVLEYVCSEYALLASPFVLANGDIALQYITITEEIEFDTMMADQKINIDTYIIDVETGTIKPVENFNYFLASLDTRENFLKNYVDSSVNITLNETNVRNVAIAIEFSKGSDISFSGGDLVFLDDALNVNYVFEKYCDEQDVATGGCMILNDGYVLVDICGAVASRAIAKDGKVVTYIDDEDAIVTEYGIITEEGVFDFEMNPIWTPPESYYQVYSFYGMFGKNAVYKVTEILTDDQILNGDIATVRYYYLNMENDSPWLSSLGEADDELVSVGDDDCGLMIIVSSKNGKMKLINEDGNTLIVADKINVTKIDDEYVADAVIGGNHYVFTIVNNRYADNV